MHTGGKRRQRQVFRGLAVLVILLAITGVVIQYTISDSLGHSLIGGAVAGAGILTAARLRRWII